MEDTKQAIGVWVISNNIAVELLDIEYDIDDYAIVRDPSGEITEAVILTDDESEAYIQPYAEGMELYFNECLQV